MVRRHRTVPVVGPLGPHTSKERHLAHLQEEVTRLNIEAAMLAEIRDRLALELWLDDDVPQMHIAQRLDQADRAAGGDGISLAAVQKRMNRLQHRMRRNH